ncbi:MAG: hypothetical protein H7Y31_13055 [Chitinophagaceae bacterium]|nr:hypothetical protein [Chitinophagaceae bacterium]
MKPTTKVINTPKISSFLKAFIAAFCFIIVLVSCAEKSGKISLDEARARTQVIPVSQGIRYQDSFTSARAQLRRLVTDSNFLGRKFNLPNAETFNRDAIALLLNVDSADGIRVYLAEDEKGLLKMVLVPVDKNGKDIITQLIGNNTAVRIPGISSAYARPGDGQVVENGQVCPPCEIGK